MCFEMNRFHTRTHACTHALYRKILSIVGRNRYISRNHAQTYMRHKNAAFRRNPAATAIYFYSPSIYFAWRGLAIIYRVVVKCRDTTTCLRWHRERVVCYMAVFRDHQNVFSVIHLIYDHALLYDGYYDKINDRYARFTRLN